MWTFPLCALDNGPYISSVHVGICSSKEFGQMKWVFFVKPRKETYM